MILLQVQQLTKYFGAELILADIKLDIQTKDRIALVGRNGAGKSTLLKIIAGHLAPDSGKVMKPKDVTLGYLAQNTGLESHLSIWDEMLTVFKHVQAMEEELSRLEQLMAQPEMYDDAEKYETLLKKYDQLQVKFKDIGGYQYEADIRSILHGMGFYEKDYATKIATLSGGQKTRLALAKLLLQNPDILILDEPTNHLDIQTLTWLEQYLQSYEGAILIVSHDRYFLDKIVNQVYEIARHKIKKYNGNYSRFLIQRAERYEQELKLYEKQQREVAKLQAFIQRNIARASTTKRAQSRRKKLHKMDIMERPAGKEDTATIVFDIERQSGNDVFRMNNAQIGYDHVPLAKNINFELNKGDSVALVGPNGVGKSTLLKTIVQQIPLINGKMNNGANVKIAYYDQEQANLSSNKTVLAELWDEYPHKTEKEIRTLLGSFLFSEDDVEKTVSTLSGGEKARLALAKLTMKKANFLILDEPTNHLDLDSKQVLENALIDYPGTILFVSHDRYFINRIATKVIELSREGTTIYLGNYDYYVEKKMKMLELSALEKKNIEQKQEQKSSKQAYLLEKETQKQERHYKRQMTKIEKNIEALEKTVTEKETLLFQPDVYQDHKKANAINQEIKEIREEIDKLMEEWAAFAENIHETK